MLLAAEVTGALGEHFRNLLGKVSQSVVSDGNASAVEAAAAVWARLLAVSQ